MISRFSIWPVVLLGAVLRFWGISFGLPLLSNLYIRPDESLIVMSAVNFAEKAGYPGTFAYPALMGDLCALIVQPAFWLARLAGGIQEGSVTEHFSTDPSYYFLVLRILSALAGTATIWLVWKVGEAMNLGRWAVWAALLVATSPLAVRDAHFGVTDTLFVCFSAGTVWAAFQYLDGDEATRRRALFRMALWFALAISTKYAGALLAPALLFVITRRTVPWKPVAAAATLPVILFLLLNPYHLLDMRRAWIEIYDILYWLYGWQPGDPVWTWGRAVSQVLKPLRHGPLSYVGLAGALAMAAIAVWRWRTEPKLLVLSQSLAATTLALLPFQHTVPYRYLIPMIPPIALLFCAGMARLAQKKGGRYGLWLEAALAAAVIPFSLMPSIQIDRLLSKPDTRTLAFEWISQNVPTALPIVWVGGPECEPQFRESAASIQRRIQFADNRYGPRSGEIVSQPYRLMLRGAERSTAAGYEVYRNPVPADWPRGEYLLVSPFYPLSMAATRGLVEPAPETILKQFQVTALEGDPQDFELDQIDALFLPFRPLDRVQRPGPGLNLRWIRSAAAVLR